MNSYNEISNMVIELWKDRKLPLIDGLLYNATLYIIDNWKIVDKEPFSLTEENYLEYFSHIHIHKSIEYKEMKIYVGEGSHGSDGFILVLSKEEQLYWLLMDWINPILNIECENDIIHAVNNCGTKFIIPLHAPENMEIIKNKDTWA